jgi:hypothetical protein
VGFNKAIFFKKLTAELLLLLLATVTVIQVSHSHSSTISSSKLENSFVKKSHLPGYNKSIVESKCFICEYQLTKDVDANCAVLNIVSSIQYQIISAPHYSFTLQSSHSFFETRGPPSIG